MAQLFIPPNYSPILNIEQTELGIKKLKIIFN